MLQSKITVRKLDESWGALWASGGLYKYPALHLVWEHNVITNYKSITGMQ